MWWRALLKVGAVQHAGQYTVSDDRALFAACGSLTVSPAASTSSTDCWPVSFMARWTMWGLHKYRLSRLTWS